MEKSQAISIIVVASLILASIIIFILFVFAWYRIKRNRHLFEKQAIIENFNQQLLQSQLEIQEQTFNSISQEIHDNVGQTLSLAKMQLNILERGGGLNKELVSDIRDSVGKAITDLRDMAKSLSTERIQELHLTEIIGKELMRINRLGLLIAHLQVKGAEQNLPSQKKLILFRMIQEGLQNILKHSKAQSIRLEVEFCDDCLQIQIIDNGEGFDIKAAAAKDGLGLQNIAKRAVLLGGKASVESRINGGTTVTIVTPYIT